MVLTPDHPHFNNDEANYHEQEEIGDHVVVKENVRVQGSRDRVPAGAWVVGGEDIALLANEVGDKL